VRRLLPVLASLALCGCAAPRALPALPSSLAGAPAAPRQARRAEVAFHCSHADAEIVLDGVPQGTCDDYDGAPRALGLGPGRGGSHRVAVRKPGFSTWESWLQADGTRLEVDVTLTQVTGGSTP
jgi:hypothetical protein